MKIIQSTIKNNIGIFFIYMFFLCITFCIEDLATSDNQSTEMQNYSTPPAGLSKKELKKWKKENNKAEEEEHKEDLKSKKKDQKLKDKEDQKNIKFNEKESEHEQKKTYNINNKIEENTQGVKTAGQENRAAFVDLTKTGINAAVQVKTGPQIPKTKEKLPMAAAAAA